MHPGTPDEAAPPRGWVVGFWLYLGLILFIAVTAYLNIALLPRSILALRHFDTLGHFILLGGTGYVAYRASGRKTVPLLGLAVPLGPLVVALIATVEEILQVFARFRSATLTDLLADLSGILFFYLLDRLLLARRADPHSDHPGQFA